MSRWFLLNTVCPAVAAGLLALCNVRGHAADLAVLTPDTWSEFAVSGKEADGIYGDFVLRNEHVMAVIANPVPGRNANMTVKTVGGSVIDFTQRGQPNDQLSAWYCVPVTSVPTDPEKIRITADSETVAVASALVKNKQSITWECEAVPATAGNGSKPKFACTVKYTLANGQRFLQADTEYRNVTAESQTLELTDGLRADRTFVSGTAPELKLLFAADDWFQQAYGVLAPGFTIVRETKSGSPPVRYEPNDKQPITVAAGKSYTLHRQLLVGRTLLDLRAEAVRLAQPNEKLARLKVVVRDASGPLTHARVHVLTADKQPLGSGRTNAEGEFIIDCLPQNMELRVDFQDRQAHSTNVSWQAQQLEQTVAVDLKQVRGFVVGKITSEQGGAIPCKVEFRNPLVKPAPKSAANDKPAEDPRAPVHPYFGPDSAAPHCKNLVYTPNGEFRQEMPPGKYNVIVSHGPEFDAIFADIVVEADRETPLAAKLVRTVDTAGWVSADFHSHSTPSGDNTSDTLGRVLNLACEHVEFAPCTEHNRVTTYDQYIASCQLAAFMKSCAGMELTGSPLPINHQNAFPLLEKPRTQDGGGPTIDLNPEVQISRLALWDANSEKLVQQNHPNIRQILGDKDLDLKADAGFNKMFGFMDVIEVHPPGGIFKAPSADDARKGLSPLFHWLQILNLGYQVPGVVNTDAHYNFHGSGWLRNWIRSSTDEPAKIEVMEMVRESERGHLVMSNGPFLEVRLDGAQGQTAPAIPGDKVAAPGGKCQLHVKVQCPNWLDVNRVQVFVNGRPSDKLNFTRRAHGEKFGSGSVKFEQVIPLELASDSHVIVAVAGEDLGLGPVMGPDHEKTMPVAVANPIYVDVDGGGFTANLDDLGLPLQVLPENVPAKRK